MALHDQKNFLKILGGAMAIPIVGKFKTFRTAKGSSND